MSDAWLTRITWGVIGLVVLVGIWAVFAPVFQMTQKSSEWERAHGYVKGVGGRALDYVEDHGRRFPEAPSFTSWVPGLPKRTDPPDYEQNLTFNIGLDGVALDAIDEPERTVMFYTWTNSKDRLFMCFVGGNSREVPFSKLSEYVWNPAVERAKSGVKR